MQGQVWKEPQAAEDWLRRYAPIRVSGLGLNVGPFLVGASPLKSIWPNYSGPPDCLRGPL